MEAILSDGGLLLFSAAGLAATAVAILRDARIQRAELPRQVVRARR